MKNKITKILKVEAKEDPGTTISRRGQRWYEIPISRIQRECETNIELNEKWSESTFYEDEKWTGMPLIRMNLTEKNLTSHYTN